jgi:alpha-galactosidase
MLLVLPLVLLQAANAATDTMSPSQDRSVRVQTRHAALDLFTDVDGRLYQLDFGKRGNKFPLIPDKLDRQQEFYPQWGNGFFNEPALQATHSDGNTSTDLMVIRHESKALGAGVSLTRIELKDPAYPFFVTLCFKSYFDYDVIEQWTEIRHEEIGAVELERFASSSPLFNGGNFTLTQFTGDWANEMNPSTEVISPGIKVLDSKIGVRAHQFRNPSFVLSRGSAAQENVGEVWLGSLAWPGSFQFAFESNGKNIRALCGMNPFASRYQVEPGRTFTTPAMIWAYSGEGTGIASRNLHRWTRDHVLRDGNQPRAVLLNNWEATGMNFDENKLVSLFEGAKAVGTDLFLLDDGWFGVKHPRNSDNAGLGDWTVNPAKLPHGISYLCEQAKARGLRFGIWLEPEMINPSSELFEQHPDWAIQQLHRKLEEQRNQLVLDLTRPEVKAFALKCVDDLLSANPEISYVKWDCNRYITQPGSPWLKPGFQSHLGIEYNNSLIDIMRELAARHPTVEMMLCSGGGGRVDFGSLRYFHEFWPSDMTDPLRRVTMQWDYATFFPAIAIAGHVTEMGHRSLKFAFDVAMSVRLGMDMDLAKLSPSDRAFTTAAIETYKEHVRPVVQFGDLYRIENPHAGPRAVLNYVTQDRSHAVLFIFQKTDAPATPAMLAGLDPERHYRVCEINLPAGTASTLPQNNKVLDGNTLMREGIRPSCTKSCDSMVVELVAE